MCQLYVARAIQPVRVQFPAIRICHYMDDILLCHSDQELLQQAFGLISKELENNGLFLAPEKVQEGDIGNFLGSTILPTHIRPQKIVIRRDVLKTLNDFQKLLGDINWIRPYLNLSTAELRPLFAILEGDPAITSSRQFTAEAAHVLDEVERKLGKAFLMFGRFSVALSRGILIIITLNILCYGLF